MTFTWDFNTATLLAILGQAVLLIWFMFTTSSTAKSAMKLAEDAKTKADEAHEKVAVLHGALHLHREQVAREFVDRDALRDMEARLTNRIESLGERIGEAMERQPRKS